jgi:glycosyltransferase involved in cell wall biosynthesis
MRVTVVDPPAYTPPYDHALCEALAARGLEVALATSRFRYGPVPPARGYVRSECFYRMGGGSSVAKATQHPADMLRLARRLRARGGVVHFQWLPLPILDRWMVRRFPRPRLITAHDVLPRDGGPARQRHARQLIDEMDAIVVHSRAGSRRLVEELGVPAGKVHVVPHGAFAHLAAQPGNAPLDPSAGDLEGRRVALFFGLVRPYKGVDVLIEAFASAPPDAVLLVVGMPRMPLDGLRRQAVTLGIGDRVRFVPRFVADSELPAYFRRADVVVLPYREIEHSGVFFTALAFGRPMVVSAVGGVAETAAEHGVARIVPAGDPVALGEAVAGLLGDEAACAELSVAALRAAAGPCSWDRAAELTAALYERLTEATG